MKTPSLRSWIVLALGLIWGTALFVPRLAAQQADIVLHNGKILTVDANFSTAEAVAITGNKITAVGRNQEVLQKAGPNTLKLDLKGRTVVPGLIDTHLHITGPGAYMGPIPPEKRRNFPIDWRGVTKKEDVLNQIRGNIEKFKPPAGEWLAFQNRVSFTGLNEGVSDRVPMAKLLYDDLNRWDLDTVSPNHPIVLNMGIPDENALFVNSKGWDVLWTKHGDFIKKYGRFWIDSAGRPDGHMEPPATRLLLNLYAPGLEAADMAPGILKRLEELSAQGHTTISTKMRLNGIAAYKLLEQRGQQIVRMAYGLGWDYFGSLENPSVELKQFSGQMGAGSDINWIASFSPSSFDGAATRACTNQQRAGGAFGPIDSWFPVGQCHTDNEYRGAKGRATNINGNYFQDFVLAMGQHGLRLANDHVAGDRSVANLLGMIERIQRERGPNATKYWAFDHCTLVDPKDFPRAAKLGVMFSCAPKYIEDVAPAAAKSYGEKVANTFVVPVKSLLDAGAKVVYEADRDTYVWEDLELYLTRKSGDGKVYGPQEKLDKITTLKTVTRWAAEYVLRPDKLGSIEVGKLADIAVLDKDYLTIPDEQVSEIQPQLTIMDGKVVFVHPSFASEYNLRPKGALITTYQELKARRPKETESLLGEGGG